MKKHDDIIQGLEELWGKSLLPSNFQDVVSARMAKGQNQGYDALKEFDDDEERQETRDVIQGLEDLWGKAPLPADFQGMVSTPDWQHFSRGSESGRVVFMKDYRKRRELLQNSISLASVLAACLVLFLSWSLRDSEMTGLTTTIRDQQKALREATYKLAWVTNELARNRSTILVGDFDLESAEVEKVPPINIRAQHIRAAEHFERVAELDTDRMTRMDTKYDTALAYREACDLEMATTLLQEVINEGGGKKHGKAEVLFYLGAISHMSKEYVKAVTQYEAAFEQAVAEALETPQESDERQQSERLQESAAFNLALMHAALFAESGEPQHLEGTLTALKKSIDIGGRKRLARVKAVQVNPEINPDMVCPDYPWVEDLSVVAEEPAYREFLEEQSNRRWL